MKSNKKGIFDDISGLVTALGTIAILAAIIFLIIGETKSVVVDQGPCDDTSLTWNTTDQNCWNASEVVAGASYAYNASVDVQSATSDIPGWLPIVVITVIGGVLLTLVRFFRSG